MLENFRTNKTLWYVTVFLTFLSAVAGIIYPKIYDGLVAKEFIPGAFPQDILTVIICIVLFYVIYRMKESDIKLQIAVIGIIGSFFYLYGIFTIERVYNSLYLLYAAVFAMSFWSLLYSLMNINHKVIQKVRTSSGFFRITPVFGMIIASIFTLLWISALIPLMQNHNRIEYLYSIYILDLCFIMPAFFITSVLCLRGKVLGIMFLPAVFIVGFFVIFPLGLGEVAKPFYGQIPNYGAMLISFLFSVLMLASGVFHLKAISTP
jgi:hypothetical protein